MLFVPILHVPLAIFGSMLEFSGPPSKWAGLARLIALIVSAYGLFAPLVFAVIVHKSGDELMARGINPRATCALVGVASSILPMMAGVVLTFLGDGVAYQHAGFGVSVVAMSYWAWRERVFLFRGGTSTISTTPGNEGRAAQQPAEAAGAREVRGK
jgi:hypothetical protein